MVPLGAVAEEMRPWFGGKVAMWVEMGVCTVGLKRGGWVEYMERCC